MSNPITNNPGPSVTANPIPQSPIGDVQKIAIVGTVSITPASVAANTTVQQTFSASGLGLNPGDYCEVMASPGAFQAGLIVEPTVCAVSDTLVILFGNLTGSPITPNAGIYTVRVSRLQPGTAVLAGSGYLNNF